MIISNSITQPSNDLFNILSFHDSKIIQLYYDTDIFKVYSVLSLYGQDNVKLDFTSSQHRYFQSSGKLYFTMIFVTQSPGSYIHSKQILLIMTSAYAK